LKPSQQLHSRHSGNQYSAWGPGPRLAAEEDEVAIGAGAGAGASTTSFRGADVTGLAASTAAGVPPVPPVELMGILVVTVEEVGADGGSTTGAEGGTVTDWFVGGVGRDAASPVSVEGGFWETQEHTWTTPRQHLQPCLNP
jgi:hypothetical protein